MNKKLNDLDNNGYYNKTINTCKLKLYIPLDLINNKIYPKLLEKNDKCWTLMPALNVDKIFLSLSVSDRQELYKELNALHISAFTYTKVIESITSSNTADGFNPFETVGNATDNMDIKTLYEGVEVKKKAQREWHVKKCEVEDSDSDN